MKDNSKLIKQLEDEILKADELEKLGEAYSYLTKLPQWKLVMEKYVCSDLIVTTSDELLQGKDRRKEALIMMSGLVAVKTLLGNLNNVGEVCAATKRDCTAELATLRGTV